MVFKKDLTPLTKKGAVVKHRGKGSSTPRPDPMGQLTGRYPKPTPTAPTAPTTPMSDEDSSPLAPPVTTPLTPPSGQMPLPLDDGT